MLLGLIILVGILSFFLPTGRYEKITVDGRQVVDPNSFHLVDKTPLKFLDFFDSVHQGLGAAGPLIFMILIIGGAIRLFESTGAIAGIVAAFARRFGSEKSSWVLALIFTFFACLGAFPGMLEAAIPFAPLCISIALALGYDVFVGIAVPVVGIVIGWTAGPTNPWTVGIGQSMSQLPLFSGIGYRLLILLVLWAASLAYILFYAARIKKDPSRSLAVGIDGIFDEKPKEGLENIPFTLTHKLVLLIFIATLALIIYGTIVWKWGFPQMSSLYILGGIAAGFLCRYSPNRIADTFIEGGRTIFGGVVAVGLARGITVIMEKAGVIDTIIYYLALPLKSFSAAGSATVMFIVQTIINFFIPSGSGQAMATLPIMLPLSDILQVNRQVAILAFQFGDGLSNLCYPTVAVVIAYLTYTRVPFSRWLRFILPYMVIVWILSVIFTVGGVVIGWQ
ncbi:hypothetical protein AGMMS49944_16590 [Spirochaetia bacterium]|nr:hypothetical protein AGMMS49944_16590 [Spirochaetia bacterium]